MKHSIRLLSGIVHYWTYGDAKKPALIMVHGFRGTHHGLELIAHELSEFYVIVPDLPGFGESEPIEKHDLAGYVTFLAAFIKALDLKKPPILLGHSFGSIIASHFAAEYPTLIQKLILINPISAPALKGPRAAMTKLAIFYYWLGRKLPKKVSREWLSARPIVLGMSIAMAKTKDRATRRYIHNQHLAHFSSFKDPDVVAEAFKTSISHTVAEKAEQITIPTLLIVGEQDDITPLRKQHELHATIASSELFIIENVGHLIHYETPKRAASAITAFLREPEMSQ